jgi:catechol 2,3-dioxygenase-like lactoylglutathione lyase family enzyme
MVAAVVGACLPAAAPGAAERSAMTKPPIHHVTVGVRDMAEALALWRDTFGFAVLARRAGADGDLGRLFGLAPERIVDQAILGTPALAGARLHLVQFQSPDPPVRLGARPTDRLPKNLDVEAHDLPRRHAELLAAGRRFRSAVVEYPFEGLTVREVQMPAHDETNVVLVEVVGQRHPFTAQGYAGLTSFVTVVGDPEAEEAFHREVLGLPLALKHVLRGAGIEKMVGLPAGAGLDVRIFGPKDSPFGRLEVVHYQGAPGEDRYARARPPALGTLHATVFTDSLAAWRARAEKAGRGVVQHGRLVTVFGEGEVATVHTPGGLRVDVMQPERQ